MELVAYGGDGTGKPEAVDDEVGVVDVEVLEDASGFLCVGVEVSGPVWAGSQALEGSRADSAIGFGVDDCFEVGPGGPIAHAHGGDAVGLCAGGGGGESLDIDMVDGNRFFYEDMFSCIDRFDGEIDMGVGVRADGDEIDVGVVDDGLRVVG